MNRLDLFPTNTLIGQYRNVFSSRNGLDVLEHVLFDTGVLQVTDDTPENLALRKYGLRLLEILGGGEISDGTVKDFTKKLMKQPLKKETPDE